MRILTKINEKIRFILLMVADKLIFSHLPLQDKVVFSNFGGMGFGDDPKYIALELLKRDKHPQLYWIVYNKNVNLPSGISPLIVDSFKERYHICTAKIWINNVRGSNIKYATKRRNQYYIQTWHSTLGLKAVESEANLSIKSIKKSKLDASKVDLMYSNSDFRIDKYRKTFWYNGKVIKSDVPRVSIYFGEKKQIHNKICNFFKIDSSSKIALYAPTFRASHSIDIFYLDYEKIVQSLKSKFKSDFVLLVRLHPRDVKRALNVYSDNVINATPYPDMAELLCIADILFTDFSSSMFDFCILEKPVFLIAKDFDNYICNERKLVFDIKTLPFTMSKTDSELLSNITNFDNDSYMVACDKFKNKIGLVDQGKGAQQIADIVISKIYL